jgi:hypothetical protein
VAATGLLGINPYQKGIVLDISSKPTQIAISEIQKEKAKSQALDKYFMEYDKNITGAGMRQDDISDMMAMKNAAKRYFFENKESVKNTALDNGKSYTNLMSMYDRINRHIAASKENVGTTKAVGTLIARANNSGDIIEPETFEDFKRSQLPITNPNYKSFDISQFRTYKPYDAIEYQGKLNTGIKKIEGLPQKQKIEGFPQYEYWETIKTPNLEDVKSVAYGQMGKRGYNIKIQDISNDPLELKRLGDVYKKETNQSLPDIKSIREKISVTKDPVILNQLREQEDNALKEISVANTLSLVPSESKKGAVHENEEYRRRRMAAYRELTKDNAPNAFDFLNKGAQLLKTKNPELINQYFSKWGMQGQRASDGSMIGYKGMNVDPVSNKVTVNFTVPITRKGLTFGQEVTDVIDLDKELLPQLSAFHQQFLGSNAKLENIGLGAAPSDGSDKPSGQAITKQAFLKMSLPERQKFLNSGGTYK